MDMSGNEIELGESEGSSELRQEEGEFTLTL